MFEHTFHIFVYSTWKNGAYCANRNACDLFKDEVRKVGLELGIPEYLVFRQPFPGPGLGIRIIGEVNAEKVKIVQDADAIYREEIANAGLDRSIGS